MSKKAFTLIELLIVITIITLLLGVVFIAYGGVKKKGEVAKSESEMTTLVSAMKLYQNENGHLPTSDASWNNVVNNLVAGKFLDTPIYKDPWGSQYHFVNNDCSSVVRNKPSIVWSCGKNASLSCPQPESCDGQFCGDKKYNDSFGYVLYPAVSTCL